jgi:hypothetical protein
MDKLKNVYVWKFNKIDNSIIIVIVKPISMECHFSSKTKNIYVEVNTNHEHKRLCSLDDASI